MNSFYYVYILVSETNEKAHYSGVTPDIDARLNEHNREKCPHTSKNRPWKIETTDRDFARPALAGFRDWVFAVSESDRGDVVQHSMESASVV